MEALCLKDPLYELIIGNIPGARVPDDPDETWCVKAAAITRSQARMSTETKPLKVAEIKDQLAISKNRLIQLQEEKLFLSKYMKKEALLTRNGTEISHMKRKGVLYRFTKKADTQKEELRQILLPKDLRKKVMKVAHDIMLAGQLRVKKTEDRILNNFYWSPRCSKFLQVV